MLVVIAGPGGVGKDTIAQLVTEADPRFAVSRSWTTRKQRPGEAADAYVFVDRRAFEKRIAEHGFLEWAEYHGNLYGTPAPDRGEPRHLILVIETQGARNVLAHHPETPVILIAPPSVEVLEARLRGRGDDDDHVRRRLQAATDELEAGLQITDQIVVNDELTRAVADVRRILENRLSGENESSHG